MNRRTLTVLAVVACGALAATTSSAAAAPPPFEDTDSAISQAAPEVLKGAVRASEMTKRDSRFNANAAVTQISLPAHSGGAVHFRTGEHEISIGLPQATAKSPNAVTRAGLVAYDNRDGSSTVPVAKDDGSLQILTVIENDSAPTEYAYDIDMPEGFVLDLADTGGVGIVSEDQSSFAGAFAAPWAKDANGRHVPTHFEVRGESLVQVVDHVGLDITYPVVADPWLNQQLYYTSNLTISTWNGKPRVNATPTQAGEDWAGVATWWAHSDEIKNKLATKYPTRAASQRWNDTVQEQLYCHIVGLPYSKPEYNLEMARQFKYWEQLIAYKCNFPESTWSN